MWPRVKIREPSERHASGKISWFFVWVIGSDIFWGFLITTVILFVFAGIAALIGIRWIKKGAPPTPDMAIEEAHKIRDTVSHP